VSHGFLELFYVANIDYSWLAKFMSLLVLPAAHSDLAIVLGGYLVVNQLMPVGVVVATIYFGMVASDLILYGIGTGARRLPWLGRFAVNKRTANFGGLLQRNLFGLAALSRVVPGAVFVVMIACGWTRVPWTRVAFASLFSSALYLPLMLYLVIVFGDALDDRAGLWTWPFLLGLIVALAFMRYRVFTFHESLQESEAEAGQPLPSWRARPPAAAYRRTRALLPQLMRPRPIRAWPASFNHSSNPVELDVRNPAAGP
jgi:membrane protein DedA with SNARE-associated domain